MTSRSGGSGDWLDALVAGALRRPRAVFMAWGVLALLGGIGMLRLEIDTTTSSFLDRAGPPWQRYQQSLQRYGGDEFVTIALEGETPLDPQMLRRLRVLTEELRDLPGVRRVDSLSSVPVVLATPSGDLTLLPSLREDSLDSPEGVARIGDSLRRDRIAPGLLISGDWRTAAINIVLDENVDGDRDLLVAEVNRRLEGQRAWISGVPVFRTRVNTRTGSELALFVPLTLVLVGAVVLLGFRRPHAVVISLLTSGLGTWIAIGAMAATGTRLSLSTVPLPPILLALGSAYTMHVLSTARGRGDPDALREALQKVARPIALSGLTTAIGFLAMSTVEIGAIRELGTYGALGAVCVLAAALTLAPAALRLWPLGEGGPGLDAWLRGPLRDALVRFVVRRRVSIFAAWLGVLAVSCVGLFRLQVETDIILWFPHGSEIRDSYESIRSRLSGITPLNVVVEAEAGRAVTEPHALAAIDALARHLESLPEVGRALSLADPLRQIHAGFLGDPAAGLPEDRALIEQYLVLLASVEHLDDVVTGDRRSANVLLRADINGSRRLLELGEQVADWWRVHGPPDMSVYTTGIMYEFGRAEEEIAHGQIRGLALAFAAVAAILLLVFRAPLITLAALAPNAIPLAMTYGFMGFAGIPLDAATICVGSVALGIAVDDTVHVATSFEGGLRAGRDRADALHRGLGQVLPALVLTTLAIGLGFAVLGASEFTMIRNFGLVTAGMVVLCLLADLTLLPALLYQFRGPKQP